MLRDAPARYSMVNDFGHEPARPRTESFFRVIGHARSSRGLFMVE
jgi:hypothetical protein